MKLSLKNLNSLNPAVAVPKYDRRQLQAGIVHIGVGNFHRAHQQLYLDNLFAMGKSHDWAVIGAGVRPADEAMRLRLEQQDYLTTGVELSADGAGARILGSMIGFIPVDEANAGLITGLSDPSIRIVSLTVTEGGYYLDAKTGDPDFDHPDLEHDVLHPDRPKTAFGAIIAALKTRQENGAAPLTVMSCDNIEGNGDVTRRLMVGLARLSDPELSAWIETKVTFPNSMVDGIVPVTGEHERALVASRFGVEDQAPVTYETYRQWVIEDKFAAGRPQLEDVGVTFSADVHTYERMKIRVLNGGHALMNYPAGLLGYEIVHEAMADPLIHAFFRKVEEDEVLPHVRQIGEVTPSEYLDLIDRRFSNTAILDTIRRLGFDGSNRQPKFIISSVADGLRAGTPVSGLALVSACWARYCAGTTDAGAEIAPNDPDWSRLQERALAARDNPDVWLEMDAVYGQVSGSETFRTLFATWLRSLWEKGTAATLKDYLQQDKP
jgi:mannitol 2-dehydrogenase